MKTTAILMLTVFALSTNARVSQLATHVPSETLPTANRQR